MKYNQNGEQLEIHEIESLEFLNSATYLPPENLGCYQKNSQAVPNIKLCE